MPQMMVIDPDKSAHARFAFELRRYRIKAGLTQAQLGRRIGFTGSMVGAVETLKRTPSESMARLCDKALGLDGVMLAFYLEAWPSPAHVPDHYQDWTNGEQRATDITMWDPLLVPGIFQTQAYARRIFSRAPGITPDRVDQLVEGRMRRKRLLAKAEHPVILSLIDEMVLRRRIGDSSLMREQLEYLLDVAQYPRVAIQIVPFGEAAVPGLLAPFSVARSRGTAFMVYVESLPDGRTIGDRGAIAALDRRIDRIRIEAYSRSLSFTVLQEALERWT